MGLYRTHVSLSSTIKVQEALTEFSTDTQSRSTKLENNIIKESRSSLDDFINELKKYNKIRYKNIKLDLNIKNIEHENRKTEDKIHGFIVKKVAKRISLDDAECLEILKLDPGNKKKKKLDEFYRKVLTEAVLELNDVLRTAMETQTETVEQRIQQRIDSVVDICESKAEEFNRIQQIKKSGENEMEKEQIRLSYFISMCEYGLNLE